MKKYLLFLPISLIFFLAGDIHQARAAYVYENIAFYGKSSPSSYVSEGIAFYANPAQTDGTLPVYRFRNTNNGDHFYTISEDERKTVSDNPQWGYVSEGIAFYASQIQISDTLPLYRFRNTTNGDHLYTISENEKATILNNPQWGYIFEKIAFYVDKTQVDGTRPVYRFSNVSNGDHFYTISQEEKNTISLAPVYRFANTITGNHFYTASLTEKKSLLNNPQWGYVTEGVAFYEYTSQANGTLPVYRFSNTKNGDHLYTISESEKKIHI